MSHTEKSLELHSAIERLDRKLARKLILDERAELKSVRQQSLNIFLRVAVESRDTHLVRKLLELKPDLNSVYSARILWIVADDGDTDIASMLVRAGADLNINNPYRPNFLHIFATSKSPKKLELAVLMMDHGANLIAEDTNGYTALTYAINNENFNFARELLKRDAPVEAKDVQQAICSPNATEWIMLFIENHSAHESSRNERIINIFSWICDFVLDDEKIANWLNMLLDMEVPDVSVFYKLVICGKPLLVKTILASHRVDNNIKMMLLHPAVILGDTTIAKMLIEWGVHVNYRLEVAVYPFPPNVLPIMAACASQSVDNIQLLLRLGADINDTPDPNHTVLYGMLHFEPNFDNATRLVIKHMALLITKGDKLNNQDLELIYGKPNVLEFYEECLKEIQRMKECTILNKFVVYSILTTNMKELSILSKRQEFAKNSHPSLLTILFPLYCKELNWRITKAETRRDLLSTTENILYEILGNILPDLVIEKIMSDLYYSDIHLKFF